MTTAYTSLLGLALPVTGELSGTWGDTVNDFITQYTDAAVAGTQTISGAQTAVTLSTTNGFSLSQAGSAGTTGSAQYAIINCTGNPASTLVVTAPSTSKVYLVRNATSTNQSVTIKGAATTGVTVAAGKAALIAWSGSDFSLIATTDASKLSGLTANGVAYADGSAVLTTGTALTFSGGNLTNTGGSIKALAAATQDAVQLSGRAGGTSSYTTTLTPGTLTANNTLTLPTSTGTLITTANVTQSIAGPTTFSTSTGALNFGTSQTTGTWTAGGTAQTGTMTLGQSTDTQTVNIATGVAATGKTKTINFGTAGASGSITNITYGSATAGSTTTHAWNANGNAVMSIDASSNYLVDTATGTIKIGGTAQTGAITLGQSTDTQTVNIATGVAATGKTKTINIGTAGSSGSVTNLIYGSATNGSNCSHRWYISSGALATAASWEYNVYAARYEFSIGDGAADSTALKIASADSYNYIRFTTSAGADVFAIQNNDYKLLFSGASNSAGFLYDAFLYKTVLGPSASSGGSSNSAYLLLSQGSTTNVPLQFETATALKTTAVAGGVEYDGTAFYGTTSTTTGRGFLPAPQYFRLSADGSATGNAGFANFFGSSSGITLNASGFYEVEYTIYFLKTTAATVQFRLSFSSGPTNCNAFYMGTGVGGGATVGTGQTAAVYLQTGTTATLPLTGSLTTGVNHVYVVKSIIQANASTTLDLQIQATSGTVTPRTGSYYKVTALPAGNTGTFV